MNNSYNKRMVKEIRLLQLILISLVLLYIHDRMWRESLALSRKQKAYILKIMLLHSPTNNIFCKFATDF